MCACRSPRNSLLSSISAALDTRRFRVIRRGATHLLGVDGLGTGNGKIGQAYRLAFAFARPRDPGDPDAKGGMELGADGWAMAMALA